MALGTAEKVQSTLERWLKVGTVPTTASTTTATRRRAVALFDRTGLSIAPWSSAGFDCVAFDPTAPKTAGRTHNVLIQRAAITSPESIRLCIGNVDEVAIVFAMPPCRDLCAAGARWWGQKAGRNPQFKRNAENFLKMIYNTLYALSVPFVILVPSGPAIRRCFPRHAVSFHPHEYGGMLPQHAPHPLFSELPPQDAYTKRTLCFTSPGLRLPWKRSVPPQFRVLKLKNGKTKRVSPLFASRQRVGARTTPPFAFCTALFRSMTGAADEPAQAGEQ